MTKENNYRRSPSKVGEAFRLTNNEDLFDRVSNKRFLVILQDEQTQIHAVSTDSNNYGEFLFVATSRPRGGERISVTFYGLGFHEYRERWIIDQWSWYEADTLPDRLNRVIPKEEALRQIDQRRAEITPYINQSAQSPRGRLFEMIADLTDEDGAYTELEDLGDAADWLLDDSAE